MKVAAERERFTERGFRAREFFPHDVIALPKPYADTHLCLEKRGVSRRRIASGQHIQLNVYSNWLGGFPDALFADQAVNWHGQQFGRKGLIAAAGLFIEGRSGVVTYLQSDICQQIYRSPSLNHAASARLDTRFRYWYRILFNAILDFASDRGLDIVHSPTADHIVGATKKRIDPGLFTQIYDSVGERYACRRDTIDRAEYWSVALKDNHDRIARLNHTPMPETPATDRKVICICHDIESNIDTNVPEVECREALYRMLAIERAHGVRATYQVLGRLFRDLAPVILASDSHALAFHSYDHQIGDPSQLARTREVDLQVKGYRPPQSKLTADLSDYILAYWNFEWLLSSWLTFGFHEPRVENGIVKIPVHLDDWPLHTNQLTRAQWMARLREELSKRDTLVISLHDCYARQWLDWYPELLTELQGLGELWTCDQVVNRERFRSALQTAS
jgi:hypothetical protein